MEIYLIVNEDGEYWDASRKEWALSDASVYIEADLRLVIDLPEGGHWGRFVSVPLR